MRASTNGIVKALRPARLVLAVAALIALGGAFAHYRVVAGAKARLNGLTAELQSLRAADEAAARHAAQAPAALEDLRRLAERVPANADVGPFLEELSAALADSGVAEREVLTRPTAEGKPFSAIPLSLRATGSFDQIFQLLRRIEGMSRLTRVDRVVIEGPGGERTKPLRAEIDVSTFTRDAEEVPEWASTH